MARVRFIDFLKVENATGHLEGLVPATERSGSSPWVYPGVFPQLPARLEAS